MKKYRFLLLGLIVIGTLLSSFHYHNDLTSADKCSVCVLKHNLDTPNTNYHFELQTLDTNLNELISFNPIVHTNKPQLSLHCRAPPHFS